MNEIETISLSVVGEDSQQVYNIDFKVRTLLSREDKFIADQKRREILGPNPGDALAMLQLEAFMIGQLWVRVVDPPEWWKAQGFGRSLKDGNVIAAIYNAATDKENERKIALKQKADDAMAALSKMQTQVEPEPVPKAPQQK